MVRRSHCTARTIGSAPALPALAKTLTLREALLAFGDPEEIAVPEFDVNRAELEAFAAEVLKGTPYPISHHEMAHGAAVTEAIIRAARSNQFEPIK